MESNPSAGENIMEKMRTKVFRNLEHAENNPIAETRLSEIKERLNQLKDKFIKEGYRSAEDSAEEDMLEAEILRSSALANTLPEYKEMLQQIAATCRLPQEWVMDMLAHENAHANVAQITGHTWVGYAIIYIKDSNGNLIGMQPVNLTRPNISWGPREVVSNNIKVLEAPLIYENTLSDGDEQDLVEDRIRLKQINSQKDGGQRRM